MLYQSFLSQFIFVTVFLNFPFCILFCTHLQFFFIYIKPLSLEYKPCETTVYVRGHDITATPEFWWNLVFLLTNIGEFLLLKERQRK